MCHGKNAVARYGGSVPDLLYADQDAHRDWQAIVVGGARQTNGMPAQAIGLEESEAIRSYVRSLAAELARKP